MIDLKQDVILFEEEGLSLDEISQRLTNISESRHFEHFKLEDGTDISNLSDLLISDGFEVSISNPSEDKLGKYSSLKPLRIEIKPEGEGYSLNITHPGIEAVFKQSEPPVVNHYRFVYSLACQLVNWSVDFHHAVTGKDEFKYSAQAGAVKGPRSCDELIPIHPTRLEKLFDEYLRPLSQNEDDPNAKLFPLPRGHHVYEVKDGESELMMPVHDGSPEERDAIKTAATYVLSELKKHPLGNEIYTMRAVEENSGKIPNSLVISLLSDEKTYQQGSIAAYAQLLEYMVESGLRGSPMLNQGVAFKSTFYDTLTPAK